MEEKTKKLVKTLVIVGGLGGIGYLVWRMYRRQQEAEAVAATTAEPTGLLPAGLIPAGLLPAGTDSMMPGTIIPAIQGAITKPGKPGKAVTRPVPVPGEAAVIWGAGGQNIFTQTGGKAKKLISGAMLDKMLPPTIVVRGTTIATPTGTSPDAIADLVEIGVMQGWLSQAGTNKFTFLGDKSKAKFGKKQAAQHVKKHLIALRYGAVAARIAA